MRALAGDLQIWRGVVAGMPDSRVYLALSGRGAQGFIETPSAPEQRIDVLTDRQGAVRLVGEGTLAALGLTPPGDYCGGERFVPGQPLVQHIVDPDAPKTGALTVSDCTIAFETDFQFFQEFASSASRTTSPGSSAR